MKRSNKKGFTIVELVIVIAVIAILAAVLIPTFASLIQKANVSKDTQLVKNLNTALAADNTKHKTMSSALEAAEKFGYDVGKINASATNKEILWDSKNDVFCYYDTNTKTPEYIPETSLKNGAVADDETYKLWKIYTEAPSTQTFSIYWNSTENFGKDLTVGFDAGECTAITTLNYVRTGDKQDVVIRTNSFDTVLMINGEKDTVMHYGNAKEVNVVKVAPASYHEFGAVSGNINLACGHVVLENGSSVSNVVVKTLSGVTPTSDSVKLTVESGATANLVLSEIANVSATVEGAGASSVSKIDYVSGKVAAIGSTLYEDFASACKAAKSGDTITLLQDTTIAGYDYKNIQLVIDLNGYTLTTSKCIAVWNSSELKLKNGKVVSIDNTSGSYIIYMAPYAGVSLDNINMSGATFGIFPGGDASYLTINNSNISSVAVIAANASGKESNNIKVTINSSTISGDETAVWINVPGTVEINDSTIEGGCQALMVRAGTATVRNSTLKLTNSINDRTTEYKKDYMLKADTTTGSVSGWGQGNMLPYGALIVGDYNKSYNNTATCTLYNTVISTDISDFRELIVLSQDGNNETIFNYDSACKINDSDYVICNYEVPGLKKGLITVNGVVKQQKDN